MRRIEIIASTLVCVLFFGCDRQRHAERDSVAPTPRVVSQQSESVESPQAVSPPRWNINDAAAIEQRLADDLSYLASDALGGRGPFTDGLERAATHLADGFRAAGLDTHVYGDSPYHVFRSTIKQSLAEGCELHWTSAREADAIHDAECHVDFVPLSLSGNGAFQRPVVFAGYGITQPELGWDDYEGLDVAGSLVLVLRHEPPHLAPQASRTRTGAHPERTHLANKVANAMRHGASGVLFLTDARHLRSSTSLRSTSSPALLPTAIDNSEKVDDPLLAFHVEGATSNDATPVIHVRRALVDHWLADAGQPTLEQLEARIDAARHPYSFAIPALQLSGKVTIDRRRLTLKNVAGSLVGRGPRAEEVVIVGAHYDHLGTGGGASLAPWTVAIHNGADDNGSGSAALLEIARHVVLRQSDSSRRILFVAFSAEEMGLIGSERFVATPPVPLRDVVAMVNLDMVGRLRNDRLIVAGTGTARTFKELVQKHGANEHFRLRLDPSGFGPSDHASFHAQGIPVLHFFTGMHEDYHRPSDDFDKINVAGMRRIVSMVTETVLELAEADDRPQPFRTTTPRNVDESPTAKPATSKRRALGISVETRTPGVLRITRVAPRSVAEAAQLRVGDVIRQVQGNSLESVQQLIDQIKAPAAPRTMTLRIERDGAELELDVDFGAAP